MSRFDEAIACIDAANAEDPTLVSVDGQSRPAELVYGERMTSALARLRPDASEIMRLAARAQHIRRWTVPRSSYPNDRAGYLRWRNVLKRKHAEWAGEIMAACGYSEAEVARAGSLIRKENLKGDPDAAAIEDAASIVFLEHYAEEFAGKHEAEKVVDILAKTLAKMSPAGREVAMKAELPAPVRALVMGAIEREAAAGGARPGGSP